MMTDGSSTTRDVPQPVRKKSRVHRALIWMALLYAGYCLLLYAVQDTLMFPGRLLQGYLEAPLSPNAVTISIELESGGQVPAWFLPAMDGEAKAPTVVFFHGNGETVNDGEGLIRTYLASGFNAYLPEYRGFGLAAGHPNERNIVSDMVRLYDELLKRPEVDAERIIFHGRSIGGAVAVQVAAHRECSALILQSTFLTARMFAREYFAPSFLVTNDFETQAVLPGLNLPTLIMHGCDDSIVAVEHGRRLHAMTPNSVYVEFECDHNDFPGAGNDVAHWEAIVSFLRKNRLGARAVP